VTVRGGVSNGSVDVLRCFVYVGGLWPFLPLHDFEFHCIALLQALVTLTRNRAVVDKHVGSVVSSDEPVAFGIVEPLHSSFQAIHVRLLGVRADLYTTPNLVPLCVRLFGAVKPGETNYLREARLLCWLSQRTPAMVFASWMRPPKTMATAFLSGTN